MGYVGNQSTNSYSSMVKQDLTGASGASVTLSHPVANANEVELYINNVRQEPTTSYTTNGTTLSFVGYTVAAIIVLRFSIVNFCYNLWNIY